MKKNLPAYAALLALLLVLAAWLAVPFVQVSAAAIGNPNISVLTQVNITNSPPTVQNITIASPLTLTANATTRVYCNVSVQDYNNRSDIVMLNVTLFSNNYSSNLAPDFNQTHYTNSSCTNYTDDSTFTRTYSCTTALNFNADPGNWTCNATVYDASNVMGTGFATTHVNDLVAIGVGNLINFGGLPVLNTSANVPFNVTNYGNLPVNLSVYGYGRTEGDGLAMGCAQGNITIDNLRVSTNSSNVSYPVNFGTMMQLNSSNATRLQIPSLTVFSYNQSLESATNETIWRLFANPANSPGGMCNGTVIFTATKAFP